MSGVCSWPTWSASSTAASSSRGLPLAWVGSGALACWGGWLTLAGLTAGQDDDRAPTGLMSVTYAGQMIVGLLVLVAGAYFFSERAAARREA
ncbi:hypothetical protein ACH4U7_04330 [Streptomyces sp. NPDC020845]|uniref:hypothetical protein n=1 Tax=Streptomyces sp. NPDC020845 TaxID=3365096 RepID=UPI003799D6DB